MKKHKPSIVLADYKFSDSDMFQYLVNLQRETMKILDEHHEAIEQLERITDEPVELPKEECVHADGFKRNCCEPKEKSLSEIIKILEDLKYEMAGNEYVSETNSHQESFNSGIEMCLVKLEKVIWKLKNL